MSGYREIAIPGEVGRARRPAPRRAAPQGDWRAVLVGALKAAGTTCRSSPGTVLGSLVALGAAAFVCVNALGYQAGRHPAPILPKLAQKAPPPREAAPAAKEPVRDVARDPARPEAERAAAPAPAKPASRDAIGELIHADDTTASVTPKASPARAAAKPAASKETAKEASREASKTARPEKETDPVLKAQKALSKLGYPIKADGAMGPGTRAAIEKFERSAKLPVTGEASGRTLRELVTRAGHG